MDLYVPRLLPSLPQQLFFLIVTACCASLFPCSLCLDAQYQYCQDTSKCGSMNITYPFGLGNHGCGLPRFQINCLQNSSLVIQIHGQNYTILSITDSPMSLAIVRGENCDFFYRPNNNLHIPFSGDALFDISGKENRTLDVYKCNITLQDAFDSSTGEQQLWKCNATVYYGFYNTGDLIHGCSTEQVVVEVGKTHWVSNDTERDKVCKSCEATGGICGYNISDSTWPFLCYCKDGPRTHKCPGYAGRQTAIIIGCSVGGAALTAIALTLISMFYVKKRKSPPPGSSTSKVEKFLKEYAYEMPTRYSQSDLKKITNNFAEKLGEGGFGVVYKGMLRNGSLVAVKLIDRLRHSETQFMSEVATVGRVHHFNLVRLVGYCFESPISVLIYEYMANGSLEKFIFAGKEKHRVLRWEQLYSIALGVARGIAYLHQDCDKHIIHFDIKPHNILLDAEFTPKVSDFGLAKFCGKGDDHISMTAVRGTPGYVAPELCDRELGPVTDKSDVYSFGMLLLEIVGGRKNIDVHVSRFSQLYFPEWAFKMLENEELEMRTRGGREGEIEAEEEANGRRLMTKVGLWCIQHNYRDRPCMGRVVQMLEGNGNDLGNPPFPFNSSSTAPEIPLLSSTEKTSSIEIKS